MGIGLVVSGFILVAVSTALVTAEIASLWQVLPLAFLGALSGDHAGFYVGRWVGPRFHQSRIAAKYRTSLDRAEVLIHRRGPYAIFIGRFIPAIRSMIPALLGVSGFDRARYSLLNILACLLWAAGLGAIVFATTSIF